MSTDLVQPYTSKELWLMHCERLLRKTETGQERRHEPMQRAEYRVTRNGRTMLWTERLVRWFLARHKYNRPDLWLACFGRDGGAYTDFGWVERRQGEGVSHATA